MKKKNDWRDRLIELIEMEIEASTGDRTPMHISSECFMNDIIHFVEGLIERKK